MLRINSKPSVDIVILKMNSKPSVDIVMLKINSKPSVDIVMLKMNSKPSVDIVMLKMNSKPSVDIVMLKINTTDGLLWLGLTDDNLLYISTCRSITLWHTNQFFKFWALARNIVNKMYLAGTEGKTTRVVAGNSIKSGRSIKEILSQEPLIYCHTSNNPK
jgi:hypothetical protein